jgi:hypothetical protein
VNVEQVINDDTYAVALHAAGFTVHLGPDLANRLAYDLTEAALEPDTCDWDGCSNYVAAVGVRALRAAPRRRRRHTRLRQ